MEARSELTAIQKSLILSLMGLNAFIPFARLVMLLIDITFSVPVDSANLTFHVAIVPFQLAVIYAYFSGFIPLRVLGVICTEVACLAFLSLGNFLEPHIGPIWMMGSLYLTFFIQIDLVSDKKLKFFCYIKPLIGVLVFGFLSGEIELKANNEIMAIVSVVAFGIIGVYSSIAIESSKARLVTALRETELQLSTIISTVPVGLFVFSGEGQITLANTACFQMLECNVASEIGDKLRSFKNKNDKMPTLQSLAQEIIDYIASKSTDKFDFGQTQYRDKALHWLGQTTVWNGRPAAIVVIKNVTDIVNLERSQAETQFKHVMLRSISHELKTPTNGALHSIQALARVQVNSDYAKEKLEIAEVSCRHLLLLIDDLLDFSLLISGTFCLCLANFDLRKILGDSVELIRLISSKKKIRLVTHFDPFLPEFIYSDQQRISQVLMNFLNNAVKHTPKRGQIDISAILTTDYQMEISVKDTGHGIAPEKVSTLLHIFADQPTASLFSQGVSIGLHISNMIARQLGEAPICLKSDLANGSCFSFKSRISQKNIESVLSLSLTLYNTEEGVVPQPLRHFKLKSKKFPPILVVDDTPFNRCIIVEILRASGMSCAEASTGKEAFDYTIQRAKNGNPIKVVVMDFEMPEMNGPTACLAILAKLKELGLTAPKVIAHTAYSSEEDKQLCKAVGMVDFLGKPSTREAIVATISKHLY